MVLMAVCVCSHRPLGAVAVPMERLWWSSYLARRRDARWQEVGTVVVFERLRDGVERPYRASGIGPAVDPGRRFALAWAMLGESFGLAAKGIALCILVLDGKERR